LKNLFHEMILHLMVIGLKSLYAPNTLIFWLQQNSELPAAIAYSSSDVVNNSPGLMKNMRMAMAELVQLYTEKRDFRSQDDCSDEEEKESLKNGQKTANDAQGDKQPSQDMPGNFF